MLSLFSSLWNDNIKLLNNSGVRIDNTEYQKKFFSDEFKFGLWHSNGRVRTRWPRGQSRNLQFVQRRYTALTPEIMVWRTTWYGCKSHLYTREVLEPIFIPLLQDLPEVIFQQDNARPHIANLTLDFLTDNNLNFLPWSPHSSYLNQSNMSGTWWIKDCLIYLILPTR